MHVLTDDYINIDIISYCTVSFFLEIDASLVQEAALFFWGDAIIFAPPVQKEALRSSGDRNGSNLKLIQYTKSIVHKQL